MHPLLAISGGGNTESTMYRLEGRHLHFHRLEAAKPLQSSTSHPSTVGGRKHGSCHGYPGLPAMACASILMDEG